MLDRVVEIAGAVREALASSNSWEPDLAGACAVAAFTVARLLRRRGIPATFVLGDFTLVEEGCTTYGLLHCWTELDDGTVVDVTATQFGEVMPEVHVAQRDDRYRAAKRGRDAAVEVWAEWGHTRAEIERVVRRAASS